MNSQEKNMLKRIVFIVIGIFSTISLFYVLDLDLIKSQSLLGLIYYGFTVALLMTLIMCIMLMYQFSRMKGTPLPGFYSSIFYKHLTNEQIAVLSKTHEGKLDVFYHEFIIMRLDVIFPATLIFALLFLSTIPQVTASVINYVALGELLGIFDLSYVLYTQMQARMVSIKLAGSIPEEQIMNLDDVIRMTAMEV